MTVTFFDNHFIPSSNLIISITQSNPAVIQTYTPHGFKDGLVVRVLVPSNCGMTQLDQMVCEIRVVGPTTFAIPVNTTNFDVFAYSSLLAFAQVIPIGEPTNTLDSAEANANNITPEF